ncbi:hypothetical protein [Amycolatopsis kentuckyensis]|uniref:hypothetical protein n=1 Tax=Amycolatopsis kentuckyensis TaxID=218823 RepID=UPI0035678456
MFELFVAPLGWVLEKLVGRIAEKGADRVVDRLDDRWRRKTVDVPKPTRHRLGDVTSDVDIVVRHVPASGQRVLLTFQVTPLAGERTSGVIVPMLLDEAAHLTLPRGDYLIGALVFDPPAAFGGKPLLRGVGGIQHFVAGNRTDQLTIETAAPTTDLLEKLGLLTPDGSGPFRTALPKATVPQLSSPTEILARLEALREQAARRPPVAQPKAVEAPPCRAATADFGPRCAAPARANGLCLFHSSARALGETVRDWSTGKPIT